MRQALDKYRINPGNVGRGNAHDTHFAAMVKTALEYGKAVRIGVNWGSFRPRIIVASDG